MANSAIRIPIPGSIISAADAVSGELLRFDAQSGSGGAFVNFKPLVTDMFAFTKQGKLEFSVSLKDQTETTVWESAAQLGMVLAAATDTSGQFKANDIRLGINLGTSSIPSRNLEVVGDLKVWGNAGGDAGSVLGRLAFYKVPSGTPRGETTDNLLFFTPVSADAPTDTTVLGRLKGSSGRFLAVDTVSRASYMVQLEDCITAGNGITISDNTISLATTTEISSPTGIKIRVDSNSTGGEIEAFQVVEGVDSVTGGLTGDQPLLTLVRAHGDQMVWSGTGWTLGSGSNQSWPTVKMGVGTGNRLLPSGLLVEDGEPVGVDYLEGDGYFSNTSPVGLRFARLFGPVPKAGEHTVLTGTDGNTNSYKYRDTINGLDIDNPSFNGRFGFLPAVANMNSGNHGAANPGSFVAAFLSKHPDSGGIKVKTGDTNNDEFAVFVENGEIDSAFYGGVTGSLDDISRGLSGRNTAFGFDTGSIGTDNYKNQVFANAPVFTIRAASGDTFIRGFLSMPFIPGMEADTDSAASGVAADGTHVYQCFENTTTSAIPDPLGGVSTEAADVAGGVGGVTMRRWTFSTGTGTWSITASYTLPKGTVYANAAGDLKIVKKGPSIKNHALGGITSRWNDSD